MKSLELRMMAACAYHAYIDENALENSTPFFWSMQGASIPNENQEALARGAAAFADPGVGTRFATIFAQDCSTCETMAHPSTGNLDLFHDLRCSLPRSSSVS